MDKSKYKVLIETAQQAFELKAILNFLGEKIDPKCFDFYDDYMYLIFHTRDGDWMLVNKKHSELNDREETSAKELVNMLFSSKQAQSVLSGTCAVEVNNDREHHILIDHFVNLGWITQDRASKLTPGPAFWTYNSDPCRPGVDTLRRSGYTFVSFPAFAKEVGIDVPKFVMKSEDGVDLYEGDEYHGASLIGIWKYAGVFPINVNKRNIVENPDSIRTFSAKEAAKTWIAEQNNPKSVTVQLYYGGSAEVNEDSLTIGSIKLSTGDLHDMLNALKSLQSC